MPIACLLTFAVATSDPSFHPGLLALAPVGMAAGYLYAGNPGKAVLAPPFIYGLATVGLILGFGQGWDAARIRDPWNSCVGCLNASATGAAVGYGVGTGLVLIDQAVQPQWGGPLAAPAVSLGTVLIMGLALQSEELEPVWRWWAR